MASAESARMDDDTAARHPPPVPACVDLSAEAARSETPPRPVTGPEAWLAGDVAPASCILTLERDAVDEIEALAERIRAAPHPMLLRSPDDHPLDAVRKVFAMARASLDHGVGVAVIDRLPLDMLDDETARAVFWTIGSILARPVAQKWDGTMLYDVADTGQSYGYGVRGSWTNVELVFHTDNAFGTALPRYVGLLCIRPALEGGTSRFCSLFSVHNRLLERFPHELDRLYRPMLFDRQAEHAPDAPRVVWAPVFSFVGGRLRARTNTSLIRKGYAVAGVRVDEDTRRAVEALEQVVGNDDLWFELPIERGQLQYLENQRIAHYRSAFADTDDPQTRRLLVRMWHRDEGLQTYDG